jgi:hypothetical protein
VALEACDVGHPAFCACRGGEEGGHELAGRGVTVSGIRHKSPVDDWTGGFQPGTDPQRRDYASFADPDGNTWVIQEIGHRPPHDVADIILDAARDGAATP